MVQIFLSIDDVTFLHIGWENGDDSLDVSVSKKALSKVSVSSYPVFMGFYGR